MAGAGETPTHRWEIPVADWDALQATVRDRLERQARICERVPYSGLVSGLPFDGANSHALAHMLGQISGDTHAEGKPLLSAVAVYISGDRQGEPGPGFYAAAKSLGLLREDATEEECRIFWAEEIERCYDAWGGRRRRAE